jgi:peptidyl-prolyl cis-trans isomerase A (cyclophilin A)
MKSALWILLIALLVLAIAGCPRQKPTAEGAKLETRPPVNQAAQPGTQTATPPGTEQTQGAQTPTPTGQTAGAGGATGADAGRTTPPAATPPATGQATPPTPPVEGQPTMTVVLETTKGNIELGIHRDWSPLGADHFIELVKAGFYDGAPWFRVMEGFVAQCGVAADPKMNTTWMDKTIADEPLVQGNKLGYVAFGKTGMPNSRSTHFFINLADNSASLDRQGFSCFAQVTSGMDVAQKLFRCVYNDQAGLAAPGGLEKFKAMFPQGDYIKKAYVKP